jgi:hypothetical protein
VQHVERVIGGPPATARTATMVIVALGLVAVVIAGVVRLRSREHRAGRLELGADSVEVASVMGPPAQRCDGSAVDHLRDALPADVPRTTADMEISHLRRETAARWVWSDRERRLCVGHAGDTEVGLDRAGHVIWYVASIGKTPLILPDSSISGPQAP